jgi:hypothetical protein
MESPGLAFGEPEDTLRDIRDQSPCISLRSMRATDCLLRRLRVADITPAVAAHPHVRLLGVAEEAL